MTKQIRKVSLISVHDYHRSLYDAHWHIVVLGDDFEGYKWMSTISHNYTPQGYMYGGMFHRKWPEGVSAPIYPRDLPRIATPQEQEARRTQCSLIYIASPKPVYVLEEAQGVTDTRDEADTAAQKWVLERIEKYRISSVSHASLKSYAIPLPIDLIGDMVREIGSKLRGLFRPFLEAISYSTTVRNNRLTQVETALDGGAGAALVRIYDGTRPATCGAATTLLAELTCSDPAGSVASQVLTFNAITADASANATGTATWFRCVDSTGTCVLDGNVGTSGSDMNLNSTSISTGVQVSITSFTITAGNA